MKSYRFIKRYGNSDWLQIINAETLEEAVELYDFSDDPEIEVEEVRSEKGCVLAFHITPGQAKPPLSPKAANDTDRF
jgi:hypothetical protein